MPGNWLLTAVGNHMLIPNYEIRGNKCISNNATRTNATRHFFLRFLYIFFFVVVVFLIKCTNLVVKYTSMCDPS